MPPSPENTRAFATAADLAAWLTAHHATAPEVWVQIFKKGSGKPSVDWTDCVVEALAVGWIDSQKRTFDDQSYLQRLSPRKATSTWSKKNCQHVEKLIADGRMTPSGLHHVEAAKRDGRWENAYAGSADLTIPQDFLEALESNPAAKAFFATLDRKNLFPIYFRLHTAKRPETRAKRMQNILEQLARGERFH